LNGENLAKAADRILPGYLDRFAWGATWHLPLKQGVALEWAVLAAIIGEAKERGWAESYPLLQKDNGASLFTLRNQIPVQHRAQAGHSETTQHPASLQDRFLQSVVPKVVIGKNGKHLSVFREGCPYHLVMLGQASDERPDILLMQGAPTSNYPRLSTDNRMVEFSFDLENGTILAGALTIRNTNMIPCAWRTPEESMRIPVAGIIECSVNKTGLVADNQLRAYGELFSSEGKPPSRYLVTGNQLKDLNWPRAVVDLATNDLDLLELGLRNAGSGALSAFGID